jgi:hypothetical protein
VLVELGVVEQRYRAMLEVLEEGLPVTGFCSGMHWYVEFHDPVADPDREPTVFEWAGACPP